MLLAINANNTNTVFALWDRRCAAGNGAARRAPCRLSPSHSAKTVLVLLALIASSIATPAPRPRERCRPRRCGAGRRRYRAAARRPRRARRSGLRASRAGSARGCARRGRARDRATPRARGETRRLPPAAIPGEKRRGERLEHAPPASLGARRRRAMSPDSRHLRIRREVDADAEDQPVERAHCAARRCLGFEQDAGELAAAEQHVVRPFAARSPASGGSSEHASPTASDAAKPSCAALATARAGRSTSEA